MNLIESWQLLVPIVVAIIVWVLNEISKRKWEDYKRKEESYRNLLSSIKGFYSASHDVNLKQAFIDQLQICWLYAPDEVILKADQFLELVRVGDETTDSKKEREKTLGELVLTIRKDILSRKKTKKSKLKSDNFRLLHAQPSTTSEAVLPRQQ